MSKKTKISSKLLAYLDKSLVKHHILEHKTVYTAYDAAATMGRKLEEIAKSLLIKADKDYYLILLPADHNVDFQKLEKDLGKLFKKNIKAVKIPGEKIIAEALNIKNGTVGAFGSLHKLPVVVDKKLTNLKKAIFPSGSFNHSVEMAVKDFINLERAALGSFGVKKKIKKVKVVAKPKVKKPIAKKKVIKKKITKKK